jgi:putative glycosyltransferase (TIGR04348 family)
VDVLLALHARRSAASVAAYAQTHPDRPVVVTLTGTDLYQDLAVDASTNQSLALARHLIVLQEQGLSDLPEAYRAKASVCFQSTPRRKNLTKTARHLRAVAVGHLRAVKDPLTLMRALGRLQGRPDILLDHLGGALEPALGDAARRQAAQQKNYRWLGAVPHARVMARIQRAHVLVHPSVLEGGAHVVMEAVQCGTPVLASRMPGNVGMLGSDYAGYFDVGDDAALSNLLSRARDDSAWLAQLHRQCEARRTWFDPEREASTLHAILRRAMA